MDNRKIKIVDNNKACYTPGYVNEEVKNHEFKLFCDIEDKDKYNIEDLRRMQNLAFYKENKESKESKESKENKENKCPYTFAFPVFKTIFDIFHYGDNSILTNLKESKNKSYIKRLIFQIVNGIYNIHKNNSFVGTLSDESVTIDDQLDAKISFISDSTNNSSVFWNCFYFYEPDRFKNFNNSECFDQEIDTYQKYDIFALGMLLKQIINFQKEKFHNMTVEEEYEEVKKTTRYFSNINDTNHNDNGNNNKIDINNTNNNNDGTDNDYDNFSQKMFTDIINPCLLPMDQRPTIFEIKKNLSAILLNENEFEPFERKSNTFSVNSKNFFSYLYKNVNLIYNFKKSYKRTNSTFFNLSIKYSFDISFNGDSFISLPVPKDTDFKEFKDIVFKLNQDFYQKNFFSNIYFCNFKDLLKLYSANDDEIIYWLLYLSNFIHKMHQIGDYLPENFSIENILVSFLATVERKEYDESKSLIFQTQLSIFPFINEKVSKYYSPPETQSKESSDVYLFGVLMLELLYRHIFNIPCFIDSEEEANVIIQRQYNSIIKELKSDKLSFLKDILESCLFKYNDTNFDEIIKYLDSDKYCNIANVKSMIDECNGNPTMNKDRFFSLFRHYSSFKGKKLLIIFFNTIFNLCPNPTNEMINNFLLFDPKLIQNCITNYSENFVTLSSNIYKFLNETPNINQSLIHYLQIFSNFLLHILLISLLNQEHSRHYQF
ncbi:hypothetical protein M9Y10_044522 [Tritrichomonas musculus]|uniref:Protein kinase domain-containing protein n=1 Tax=Tritrichomonas musculus TaxID=1915356 RepID=A0ABR2JVJ4_9EUKA